MADQSDSAQSPSLPPHRPPGTDRAGMKLLDRVEALGNKLPSPTMLFVLAAVLVMVLSHLAVVGGWSIVRVEPRRATDAQGRASITLVPVRAMEQERDEQGRPRFDPSTGKPVMAATDRAEVIVARSLLTSDGLYHALSRMVWNFVNFAPLGIVLAAMLGVGVAERTGLIAALLRATGRRISPRLLTPAVVFLGVMSSAASDAGFIVLPPLAAALFAAFGRSPVAGVAAAFAGVAGGFSANLLPTSLDPVMGAFSSTAAQVVAPGYTVGPLANWYFMAASTVYLTLVGWWVTARFVEPRFEAPGGAAAESMMESEVAAVGERRALWLAAGAFAVLATLAGAAILVPGAPLYGVGASAPRPDGSLGMGDRWSWSIMPLLMGGFFVPGVVFGAAVGTIKREKDVVTLMVQSIADMAPVIVLAFFAAQFIEYLKYSRLDTMMAMGGGSLLASASLPWYVLIPLFIAVCATVNLLVASMSAKYAMMSPVFVPMMMMVGVSPELTQTAYRIGDSVTNTVAPLNPYLVVILVVLSKYAPKAGTGTLLAMMLPYAVVFGVAWTALLVAWVALGIPLGPGGVLWYVPAG